MRLDSGNRLAFAERTECIDIYLVKIGFATKCAMCGDGWGELAGVLSRGLLVVESVVWALRAGDRESAVAVALVRASDRTENMSYR
jgi:hypothetical protein